MLVFTNELFNEGLPFLLNKRLQKIISFWKATEKFKLIERIPCLSNQLRRENDAEHSWHLALMIMSLKRELGVDFDELKTLKLAIIHDLPEIYTGDTWVASKEEKEIKRQKELAAGSKIFSFLPDDLAQDFFELWQEYEEGKTIEAKIAKALDKICYPLQYSISKKIVWHKAESTKGGRREYALPHTEFNQPLTQILDHLLDELDQAETIRVDRLG